MAKIGIDISSHQGDIDLEALQDQIDFVIIRVGYGTRGTIDTQFERNADLCEQLGIPMGFYWYSYALDEEGAEQEAEAFLDAIAPYTPEFGCWFDMEDADGYKARNGMPSDDELQAICYKFCEIVEDAGYYCGVYASQSWFNNQLAGDMLNRFDQWVAQWPTSGGYQRGLDVDADERDDVSLWQFTSVGDFSGYWGNLDTNYAYHDFPNPGEHPQPEPQPEPTPEPEPEPEPQPEPEPEPTPEQKFDIGEQVLISGALYTNAYADAPAGEISERVTNITRYVEGAPHPYNTTGDLGWMDEDDIEAYDGEPEPDPADEITKGCRVRFTGTKSYSGIPLADWTYNYIFNVIEVSGDRVVIGKGTAVTAAVNIRDCQKV
jgi:GH25 family lysozyme M1 (1,4-beta-N-acetylmuramidase)